MADPIQRQNFQAPTPVHRNTETSSGGAGLGRALGTGLGFAAQLAGSASGASPFGAIPGVAGSLLRGSGGAIGDTSLGLGNQQSQFAELLELQNQKQVENQIFSTLSNVSKTEHETRMAAVRNIRA